MPVSAKRRSSTTTATSPVSFSAAATRRGAASSRGARATISYAAIRACHARSAEAATAASNTRRSIAAGRSARSAIDLVRGPVAVTALEERGHCLLAPDTGEMPATYRSWTSGSDSVLAPLSSARIAPGDFSLAKASPASTAIPRSSSIRAAAMPQSFLTAAR